MRQPLFAFLGLRCGVPPRQIHDINAVCRRPAAGRKKYTAHGLVRRGRPEGVPPGYSTTVHSGIMAGSLRATSICPGTGYSHKSRRYALRDVPYGIAYRRWKRSTKNTRPAVLCVSAKASHVKGRGTTKWWRGSLRRPVARFHHSFFEYNGRLLRTTSHEPRTTAFFFTSRGLLEAMSLF